MCFQNLMVNGSRGLKATDRAGRRFVHKAEWTLTCTVCQLLPTDLGTASLAGSGPQERTTLNSSIPGSSSNGPQPGSSRAGGHARPRQGHACICKWSLHLSHKHLRHAWSCNQAAGKQLEGRWAVILVYHGGPCVLAEDLTRSWDGRGCRTASWDGAMLHSEIL